MERNAVLLNKDLINAHREVYRIIPVANLLQILASRSITLVKPKVWEKSDPFENFMLHSSLIDSEGFEGDFAFKDSIYVQCWSTLSLSDAMWRLYAPNMDGVRVKVQTKSLYGALVNHAGKHHNHSCYIGKVVYRKTNDLYKIRDSLLADGAFVNSDNVAKTLLYKRLAFKHESEVRLMFLPSGDVGEVFDVSINPDDFIQSLVFDPRMKDRTFQTYKSLLIDKLELFANHKNKHSLISKSSLYDRPESHLIAI